TTGKLTVWSMNSVTRLATTALAASYDSTDVKAVGTGDFNGDGKTDIVWQRQSNGDVSVFMMNGLVRYGGSLVNPGSTPNGPGTSATRVAAVGDIDGDGKPDIV